MITHSSPKQTMCLLDKEGRMVGTPQGCRAYLADILATLHYEEYVNLHSIWSPISGHVIEVYKKSVDLENPTIAIWTSAKNRDKNALKFVSIIHEIEESLGVGLSEVVTDEIPEDSKTGHFIVKASNFWAKSPVLISALTLLMRLSIRMRLNESLNEFFERLLKKNECDYPDAAIFRQAFKCGNITELLEKSLPCIAREGYSDFLLHEHHRGIAWYHSPSDGIFPLDEKRLKVLRVDAVKFELDRLNSYDIAQAG